MQQESENQIIPVEAGRTRQEHLEYMKMLLEVQTNYIEKKFVTRAKLTTKRISQRDLLGVETYRQQAILEKIKRSIDFYTREQEQP